MFGWSTVVVRGGQERHGGYWGYITSGGKFYANFECLPLTFEAQIWYAESLNELAF